VGRDKIVTATVQGFVVVVNKEQFFSDDKTESLCVFFQPDSLLDKDNQEFEFLEGKRGRVVTTKKIYGVYSQGICFPLDLVKQYGLDPTELKEGQDLTLALKVTKYVSDEESGQYSKGGNAPFPVNQVPKTDETNLQTFTGFLQQIANRPVAITLKVDGSSMTVTDKGQLCGRNYEWTTKDNSNAAYFEMDKKYNIVETLKGTGYNVQGELVGPKIQGNPLGLKENQWLVFNVFKDGKYLPHHEVIKLCQTWGFDTVPYLYNYIDPSEVKFMDHSLSTVEDWLDFADAQVYPTNKKGAEGIVIKTVDDVQPRISFKVISRKYLLKK